MLAFVVDRVEKDSIVPHSVEGVVSSCRVGVKLGISPRRQESGKKFPGAEGKRCRWGERKGPTLILRLAPGDQVMVGRGSGWSMLPYGIDS